MDGKYIHKEYVDGRVGRVASNSSALVQAASQLTASPSP
jgi:hypothetical protein